MQTKIRRVVILAAGRGARLMPLTTACPKPMVPVAGRPILERILLGLRAAGIEEAVIVHGYLGEVVEDYFGDGTPWGLRLHYRAQDNFGGTARAMMLAEELCGDEPFVLHWGDILVDPANYTAALAQATTGSPPPACLLGIKWVEDPCAGGAVYREGDRVSHVIEKPAPGTSATHWQIGGIIVFQPCIWEYVRREAPPATGEFYITQAIETMARHGETVTAFEMLGERVHLTSPADVTALATDPRIREWEAHYTPRPVRA